MSEWRCWTNVIIVLHVLVALAIIGLVLLQHGKGADMGAGFGGGASGSLFGATGSANFLSRTTAVLATLFFLLSLGARLLRDQPADGGRRRRDGRGAAAAGRSRSSRKSRRRKRRSRRRSRAAGAAGARRFRSDSQGDNQGIIRG